MVKWKGNYKRRVGWLKWGSILGVLCDCRISIMLEGKFSKTVIRPTMLYSTLNGEFLRNSMFIK